MFSSFLCPGEFGCFVGHVIDARGPRRPSCHINRSGVRIGPMDGKFGDEGSRNPARELYIESTYV